MENKFDHNLNKVNFDKVCDAVTVCNDVHYCIGGVFAWCVQMFERETKREKILEARHREMRLKERSRSEQSREDEVKDGDGEETAEELLARAEREFFEILEAEKKNERNQEKESEKVWDRTD